MQWEEIARWAKDISAIAACMSLLIRPVRERVMGTRAMREGQCCLLRSEILRLYYRHHEDHKLREYEFQNLEQCYGAYKALGGNSFVDHIYEEMQEWDIL